MRRASSDARSTTDAARVERAVGRSERAERVARGAVWSFGLLAKHGETTEAAPSQPYPSKRGFGGKRREAVARPCDRHEHRTGGESPLRIALPLLEPDGFTSVRRTRPGACTGRGALGVECLHRSSDARAQLPATLWGEAGRDFARRVNFDASDPPERLPLLLPSGNHGSVSAEGHGVPRRPVDSASKA